MVEQLSIEERIRLRELACRARQKEDAEIMEKIAPMWETITRVYLPPKPRSNILNTNYILFKVDPYRHRMTAHDPD